MVKSRIKIDRPKSLESSQPIATLDILGQGNRHRLAFRPMTSEAFCGFDEFVVNGEVCRHTFLRVRIYTLLYT